MTIAMRIALSHRTKGREGVVEWAAEFLSPRVWSWLVTNQGSLSAHVRSLDELRAVTRRIALDFISG